MNPILMDVNGPEDGLYGRPTVIGKTEMAVFAQNDMIQQRDAEELSALAESLSDSVIIRSRRSRVVRVMGGPSGGA